MDQPVFAVDGKTARRSHDRGKGLGALHCVSVWASDFGLSLGQVACDEKSNEITAIPALLELLRACFEAGIRYAVLDPDRQKAKRIFNIQEVLAAAGTRAPGTADARSFTFRRSWTCRRPC